MRPVSSHLRMLTVAAAAVAAAAVAATFAAATALVAARAPTLAATAIAANSLTAATLSSAALAAAHGRSELQPCRLCDGNDHSRLHAAVQWAEQLLYAPS